MARTKRRLLVVDGYNVLNAWRKIDRARPLADGRDALIEALKDYAGYTAQQVIVVFDAWQSDRKQRTTESTGPVTVVFTQRAETADHYIERLCDDFSKDVEMERIELRVATSDSVEQMVVLGRGAIRVSARELLFEMRNVRDGARGSHVEKLKKKATIMDGLSEEVRRKLDQMRKGV